MLTKTLSCLLYLEDIPFSAEAAAGEAASYSADAVADRILADNLV